MPNIHNDSSNSRLMWPLGPILFAAVAITAALLLAACTVSHDRNAAPPSVANPASVGGDKAALCKFVSDLDVAGKSANTPAEALAVLKSFDGRYDQALADAPSDIRPAVKQLVDASRKAVQANDISVVSSDDLSQPAFQLDTYCGLR